MQVAAPKVVTAVRNSAVPEASVRPAAKAVFRLLVVSVRRRRHMAAGVTISVPRAVETVGRWRDAAAELSCGQSPIRKRAGARKLAEEDAVRGAWEPTRARAQRKVPR